MSWGRESVRVMGRSPACEQARDAGGRIKELTWIEVAEGEYVGVCPLSFPSCLFYPLSCRFLSTRDLACVTAVSFPFPNANAARALSSPSRCFQLPTNLDKREREEN